MALRISLFVVAAHDRRDAAAVQRRRGERADIAQAQQRHVQRARDGRGGHRQHVDIDAKFFEPLLMLDAEPLLFVDDHKSQILEVHIVAEEAVRADEDIDLALLGAFDDIFRLRRGF